MQNHFLCSSNIILLWKSYSYKQYLYIPTFQFNSVFPTQVLKNFQIFELSCLENEK